MFTAGCRWPSSAWWCDPCRFQAGAEHVEPVHLLVKCATSGPLPAS